MVYCIIINLLWSLIIDDEYDVSTHTLRQRFKEHTNLDKPTGVGDHCQATRHSVSMKNTKVLTCESNWHKRKVKEAIYIKQRAPTMNTVQGYHLPAIYNQIIPPKSEATHVTPVREQDDGSKRHTHHRQLSSKVS